MAGLGPCSNCGGDEKADSECLLEVENTGFADGLNVRVRESSTGKCGPGMTHSSFIPLWRVMKYVFLASFALNHSQLSKFSLSFLTVAQGMHFLKSKRI